MTPARRQEVTTRLAGAHMAVRVGWGRFLIVALLALLLCPLAAHGERKSKGKGKDAKAAPPMFYPGPPDQPRIQFLRTFRGESDLGAKKGKFRTFVVGKEENERFIGKPYGLAIWDGKIFVCDTTDNYVPIFDLEKKRLDALGQDYSARLSKPINIAIDSDGTRYIADTGHKRVMIYNADNHYVSTFGDPETLGPSDVLISGDELYVCDIDHGQVAVLDKKTGEERRRIGELGHGEGELYYPTNLAMDGDQNLFVTDTGNARVLKFNSAGKFVQQFGDRGEGMGRFVRPKGIAVDRAGRLYVVDAAFENVQIFDSEGKLLMFFGQAGNVPGGLNLPAKIVIDYEHVDLFKDRVAPGHEVEFLILVTSQFGANKVNVYGFLKSNE
ncbi:MAG: 6-bladed beta-propeller [Nitrospiraceae bacterium]|nr:6-bladed beta-propeller [Nitrospiraceae bacterium]